MLATPLPRTAQRGFTLIEVMVVIAIIVIVTGIAGPSFRQLIAQQRVKSAASALIESLWVARSEALKRNADVSFTFTSASAGWSILDPSDSSKTLVSQEGFPSISSTIVSGGGTFTFNAYGRLSAGSGQIEFKNTSANVYRCVTVSTSGKSTVKDSAC